MKLVLDLPDWQAELLRRAVQLVVANAILDARKPRFHVITSAQLKRLAEIQKELKKLAEQKKLIEAEIAKSDKQVSRRLAKIT